MGTRAIISKNGKPFLATHWDGYPSQLGASLLKAGTSDAAIVRAATERTIDAAHSSVKKQVNDVRVKDLMKKQNLTEKEVRAGMRRGQIIAAGDYEISDISEYGDFAEFQYDLKGGKWFFRPLGGEYPESIKRAGPFKPLTAAAVKG